MTGEADSRRATSRLQLARAAGVNPETVRLYERMGLLGAVARTPAGHRRFGPETLATLRLIRQTRALGFTLGDIRQILRLRADGPAGNADKCGRFVAAIDRKLAVLAALRTELLGASRRRGGGTQPQGPSPG